MSAGLHIFMSTDQTDNNGSHSDSIFGTGTIELTAGLSARRQDQAKAAVSHRLQFWLRALKGLVNGDVKSLMKGNLWSQPH